MKMELTFSVDLPLSATQTASILEAGLTYVLYQRGQIPLPYQQLEKSAVEHRKFINEDKSVHGRVDNKLNSNDTLINAGPLARDRISEMLLQRKERIRCNKRERIKRQALADESKAFNSIQPALDTLQRLIVDCSRINLGVTSFGHSKRVVSLALILGPSVYCPKEVYCFDLNIPERISDSVTVSKSVADKFDSTVLKQFYKKIITNAELMDFTCKPLARTYAHLCLITFGDLNRILKEDHSYKDIVRLPTLPTYLQETLNPKLDQDTGYDSLSSPYPRRGPKRKCFKFKLNCSGPSNDSINLTGNESTNSVKCSGDILFDNNSFSCYQIPLRFKGVHCKTKVL